MEEEKDRKEYVLEAWGLIWRGKSGQSRPIKWTFGQVNFKPLKMEGTLTAEIGNGV